MYLFILSWSTLEFFSLIRTIKNIEHQINIDLPRTTCLVNGKQVYNISELSSNLESVSPGLSIGLSPLYNQTIMIQPLESIYNLIGEHYAIADSGETLILETNGDSSGWEFKAQKKMHIYMSEHDFYPINITIILSNGSENIFAYIDGLKNLTKSIINDEQT